MATISAPLTDLQSGTKPWRWGPTGKKAFETCQQFIASNAVLKPIDPDSKNLIWLVTDASDVGLES